MLFNCYNKFFTSPKVRRKIFEALEIRGRRGNITYLKPYRNPAYMAYRQSAKGEAVVNENVLTYVIWKKATQFNIFGEKGREGGG